MLGQRTLHLPFRLFKNYHELVLQRVLKTVNTMMKVVLKELELRGWWLLGSLIYPPQLLSPSSQRPYLTAIKEARSLMAITHGYYSVPTLKKSALPLS